MFGYLGFVPLAAMRTSRRCRKRYDVNSAMATTFPEICSLPSLPITTQISHDIPPTSCKYCVYASAGLVQLAPAK
jgi:hypothetical protein